MAADLRQRQADLAARRDALQSEAREARARLVEETTSRRTDPMVERDRAAREQWGSEQQVKAADQQIERELKKVAEIRKEVAEREAKADRLERSGDAKGAAEEREAIAMRRGVEQSATDRVRQAQKDRAELEAEATAHKQRVDDLEGRSFTEVSERYGDAERALDAIEEQAAFLDQARLKLYEAETATSDAERAKLTAEADELVERADKLIVHEDAVQVFVPDFREQPAPGSAADAVLNPDGSPAAESEADADVIDWDDFLESEAASIGVPGPNDEPDFQPGFEPINSTPGDDVAPASVPADDGGEISDSPKESEFEPTSVNFREPDGAPAPTGTSVLGDDAVTREAPPAVLRPDLDTPEVVAPQLEPMPTEEQQLPVSELDPIQPDPFEAPIFVTPPEDVVPEIQFDDPQAEQTPDESIDV